MASAQLGSFRYDMLLDIAKFESAMSKAERLAEQRTNAIKKSFQSAVDGVGDSFSDLAGKVVAALSIEKLVEFGKTAIETADQMGKAAQKVGASVESLSALAVQAKLSNVAIDDLQVGMEKLAKNAASAAAGNKKSASDFAAVGVSLRDTNGNLKSTDVLLDEVAKKFTTYADGASKTALAQELFGKSGANLIPMLNELGEKGLAGVTKEAEQFGAVISGDAAKAANEFNDDITKLGIEAKGFANSVVQQLLPSLTQLSSQMVESGKTTDGYANSASGVATAIKGVIAAALGIKEIIYGATTVIIGLYDAVRLTFSSAGEIIGAWADATSKSIKAAFHFDKQGIDDANVQFTDAFAKIGANFAKESVKIKSAMGGGISEAAANVRANFDALFNSIGGVGKASDDAGEHLKKLQAPLVANAEAADRAAKAALELASAQDAMQKLVTSIEGKAGDQFAAAQATFTNQLLALRDAAEAWAIAGGDVDDVIRMWQQGEAAAAAQLAKTNKEIELQSDLLGKFQRDINDQVGMIGLSDRALAVAQAVKKITDEYERNVASGKQVKQSLEELQAGAANAAGKFYDLSEAAKRNAEAAHEWQSIWSSAGSGVAELFGKVLVEGGSLFDGLKNLAKQTVEQIISYFAKLAIINPILNSIFGGGGAMGSGFSLLPTMANAFGGGGGGGAAINAAVSGGGAQNVLADGGAAASGGAGGASFFSPTNWVTAGKNLFNGFFGTGNAFAGAAAGGSFVGGGGTGVFAGANAGGTMSYAPQYGGYGSALGQGLGIAGGVYAGYNEYKSAGRGAAGVVGGLAYGIGTITAGGAIAGGLGAIGGGAAAAGAGAAAGGSAAAAGIGVIPVIGWIALAAMLVNMISGGKLFGTAWQAKASTTSLAIGPNGGDASASIYETKQGALFSGLKKRNKSVDPGQDARDAAQSLFDSVEKIMIQAAHQMQTDVPPVISAALEVVNTYDKKGKVKSTKYVVDILGKKYEEASQELAATRISAEAIVATVAASEAGKAASAIAEQWRKSADTLMDGAQFLVAATADLTKGTNLLGDGGTLTQIADVVTDLQQGGEKLVETYVRLSAQTKIIQQAFELAHVSIGKTGEELVRFADSAAQAAGGADQLTQLIQQFNQAYFSAADIAQQGIDQLKKASDSALSAIGEDPAETMAKFKSDFLSALPSLTPEQLVKWYAAGVALATYTGAVTDSANQLLNAKEQYAQFEAQLYGDNFISSFSSVIAAEQQQIDTANQLAKAAGLAGASQEDLARITAQGTAAVRKAIADLTTGIQSDIVSLFGASQVGYDSNNPFGPQYQQSQQAQQDQANAARISNAYDLIEKLGDYAFASGKTIDDVLKLFPGLSIDQIGGAAGITADDTRKQIQAAEDNAAALTNMLAQGDEQTGLLANILATLQGNALPYDVSRLGAPPAVDLTSSAPLSKGGNQVGSPNTAKDMKAAIQDGSKPAVDEQKRTNDLLEKLVFALTGQRVNTNRNTAGRAGNFLPA